MAIIPTPQTSNPSEHEPAKIGWQWSELTWRARFILLGAIVIGAALVLGIIAITAEMDENSPMRRGLFALLLIPVGIAGATARSKKQTEKASRVSSEKPLRSDGMDD